ncbi:MAG TPA: GtrA family protein [Ktedonobacteraceae bacterium]|nr:GtrA family protein [Ktedonobacteraceae bacterium]
MRTKAKISSFLSHLQKPVNSPSYHATRWAWTNRVLDFADSVTGRRAGLLQRLFSFLFIGGIGAIVNVLCFTVAYASLLPLAIALIAYFGAFFLATEVSILMNFVLNDRITFRHLHTSDLSWWMRCVRFHITSIGGTLLTFCISFSLLHFIHILALLSQAIALAVATIFNFVGHHFFTYRHKREGAALLKNNQTA